MATRPANSVVVRDVSHTARLLGIQTSHAISTMMAVPNTGTMPNQKSMPKVHIGLSVPRAQFFIDGDDKDGRNAIYVPCGR